MFYFGSLVVYFELWSVKHIRKWKWNPINARYEKWKIETIIKDDNKLVLAFSCFLLSNVTEDVETVWDS